MGRPRSFASASVIAALVFSACAAPPHKEIDQAQGAIDAARAAGAEQYATTEYSAAVAGLKNANDASAAGDYRLALNYALESREQAQNAAREAADSKASIRAEVERAIADIAILLSQTDTRLRAARRARIASRVVDRAATDLASTNANVQKAGEAISAGDYLAAKNELEGVKERIEKAFAAIAPAAPPGRRRR